MNITVPSRLLKSDELPKVCDQPSNLSVQAF
jgi:hypothetical protein